MGQFPSRYGTALIVTCLLGSIQLFFIGLIGEYIMSINDRVKRRPLVVEDERLNFLDEKKKKMRQMTRKQKMAAKSESRMRGIKIGI